jgi:large subunit ribosomal protein L30
LALLLVVNLHGKINSTRATRRALGEMKVEKKFTASVLTDDGPTVGMLKSCKEFVAWGPVEKETLATLLEKKGMISEKKHLGTDALAELGAKSYEELASRMLDQSLRLSALKNVRPFFRLSPPRGGFKKSLRRQASDGGVLGKNPELAEIVRRMV